MAKEKEELPSFEKAYARLETILEQLNSGQVALDVSLKLYEEADQLIRACNKQLMNAERKIEMLVKNREGKLERQPFEEQTTPCNETL